MPQEPQASTAPTGQRTAVSLLPELLGGQGSFPRTGGPPNAQGRRTPAPISAQEIWNNGQGIPSGPDSSKPIVDDLVYRQDLHGNPINKDGSRITGPFVSPLMQSQGQGPMAAIPRPAPGNPEYAGLTSDQVIAKARGEAQGQLDDPNYIPTTQQGWEAKQARQNELAGQRRAVSVQDMLSGNGTRAIGENGMPIRNSSGAPLPNTVQGSVGGDGSPVYRPDGSRMVEPVGGWNPNQTTEPTPLNPQAQTLRDAMQKRYDAAQATKQQNLMARLSGQAAPATGPRADSSNSRWMAAREERQGRRDAARELIAQRGMAQAANRTARIEARKNANMPMNPMQQMAMRNPAFALGMQRIALDAQQANLDRDIQREELAIRKDALKGDVDERRETRLQAMKMQQADNELKKQQLDQSGELGRAGLAQDQMQHEDRQKELQIQGSRYDAEIQQQKRGEFSANYRDIAGQNPGWTHNQIMQELNRRTGAPATDPNATQGGTGQGAGQVQPAPAPGDVDGRLSDLYKAGDFAGFEQMARGMGLDIDDLYRKLSGKSSANRKYPEGMTFLGALSSPTQMPFNMAQWMLGN